MKDTGSLISPMDQVDSSTRTVMSMKENGWLTKPMERVPSLNMMEILMLEPGLPTNRTDSEKKPSQMDQPTRVNTSREKRAERVFSLGLTDPNMMVVS